MNNIIKTHQNQLSWLFDFLIKYNKKDILTKIGCEEWHQL